MVLQQNSKCSPHLFLEIFHRNGNGELFFRARKLRRGWASQQQELSGALANHEPRSQEESFPKTNSESVKSCWTKNTAVQKSSEERIWGGVGLSLLSKEKIWENTSREHWKKSICIRHENASADEFEKMSSWIYQWPVLGCITETCPYHRVLATSKTKILWLS